MCLIPNCYNSLSRSLITTWGKQSKWEYFSSHEARHNFSYYQRVAGKQSCMASHSDGVQEDTWYLFKCTHWGFCNENHVHLLVPASFDCYLKLTFRVYSNNFKNGVWWYLIFLMYSEYFKRKGKLSRFSRDSEISK